MEFSMDSVHIQAYDVLLDWTVVVFHMCRFVLCVIVINVLC